MASHSTLQGLQSHLCKADQNLQAARESPVLSIIGNWNNPCALHAPRQHLEPPGRSPATGVQAQGARSTFGWILHVETQDFSSLNMLHSKKHPRQPHLKHPLTHSILQVLQCTPAQTLIAPTLRRCGDEEL